MRALIVLAVLGACSAVPTPFIDYTPEVAAERLRFLEAFKAAADLATAASPNSISQQAAITPSVAEPVVPAAPAAPLRWEGPFAATVPAGVDGTLTQVSETLDVAALRKAFEVTYQAQLAAITPLPAAPAPAPAPAPVPAPAAAPVPVEPAAPAAPARWAGPFAATKPAAVDGPLTPVSDTSDVAAATAEFLRAYKAAVAATAPAPAVPVAPAVPAAPAPAPAPALALTPAAEPVQARWTGAVAATVPAGLPGSAPQVPDTAEVAAARAAFLRVYQQAVAATSATA